MHTFHVSKILNLCGKAILPQQGEIASLNQKKFHLVHTGEVIIILFSIVGLAFFKYRN